MKEAVAQNMPTMKPPNRKQAALLRKLVWNAEKRVVRTDEEGKLSLNTKLPDGLLF
jgi:hypothetical protein